MLSRIFAVQIVEVEKTSIWGERGLLGLQFEGTTMGIE